MRNTSMKSAEFYRAEASKCRARAHESFERSDTDGFLSQHSSNLMALLYDKQANIAENGGYDCFNGLYEGDRRVRAKIIETVYGRCWMLDENEIDLVRNRGGMFIPIGSNSKVQKRLGLSERAELAPAWAKLASNGTGISGNCWIYTFRTGCQYGSDAVLITD